MAEEKIVMFSGQSYYDEASETNEPINTVEANRRAVAAANAYLADLRNKVENRAVHVCSDFLTITIWSRDARIG